MQKLGPVTLSGPFLRLEPLRPTHLDGLLEAAQQDRIWTWLPRRLQSVDAMAEYIEQAMDLERSATEFAFTVILQESGRIVGSTRFMDIAPSSRGLEIGGTWYAPEVWGSRVNPEAKLLLMRHAFESWRAIRAYFKTDALNERSRSAILRLGAQFEGILRNHRIRRDGSYRGSAVYSVIDSEWPKVKSGLIERLSASESVGMRSET